MKQIDHACLITVGTNPSVIKKIEHGKYEVAENVGCLSENFVEPEIRVGVVEGMVGTTLSYEKQTAGHVIVETRDQDGNLASRIDLYGSSGADITIFNPGKSIVVRNKDSGEETRIVNGQTRKQE